jgi:hypothetical protein
MPLRPLEPQREEESEQATGENRATNRDQGRRKLAQHLRIVEHRRYAIHELQQPKRSDERSYRHLERKNLQPLEDFHHEQSLPETWVHTCFVFFIQYVR